MQTIQVGKLKAEFSSVLEKIQNNGEKFVIEYGKKHKKIALIIPYDKSYENQEERKFGILKNKANVIINDDFAMTDEDLLGS
jgi:antitoxin (DNA-binding transcriptional repressor) of toxin-antitoxin stability system